MSKKPRQFSDRTDPTRNARQARRVAELQAAALRDGFASWSTALTAWKRGEVVMVPAPKRTRVLIEHHRREAGRARDSVGERC